jgi:hypothetical protein
MPCAASRCGKSWKQAAEHRLRCPGCQPAGSTRCTFDERSTPRQGRRAGIGRGRCSAITSSDPTASSAKRCRNRDEHRRARSSKRKLGRKLALAPRSQQLSNFAYARLSLARSTLFSRCGKPSPSAASTPSRCVATPSGNQPKCAGPIAGRSSTASSCGGSASRLSSALDFGTGE